MAQIRPDLTHSFEEFKRKRPYVDKKYFQRWVRNLITDTIDKMENESL